MVIGVSSGLRQAPSGSLTAVTRLRVGNYSARGWLQPLKLQQLRLVRPARLAPYETWKAICCGAHPLRRHARSQYITGVRIEECFLSVHGSETADKWQTNSMGNNNQLDARPCNEPEWWLTALDCTRPETEMN